MKPEQTYTKGEIVRFYPLGKNRPNSRRVKVVEILEVKTLYTGTKAYRVDVTKLFPTFVFSSVLEKIPKFIVLAGSTTILETDDIKKAKRVQKETHRKNRKEYHEIHEFNRSDDRLYGGRDQLAPNDCPDCRRRPEDCKCEVKQ